MNNTSESPSSKPSLESLLRLKRAERPDEAFWTEFSIGMRQKQLAAIIEPKPWWLGASLVFRRFSFPAIAVASGAAAVLAFTVLRSGSPVAEGGFSTALVPVVETSESTALDTTDLTAASSESGLLVAVTTPGQTTPTSADAPIPVLVAAVDSVVQRDGDSFLSEMPAVESENRMASAESTSTVDVAITTTTAGVVSGSVPHEVADRDFVGVAWVDEQVTGQGEGFAKISVVEPASYTFDPSVVGGLAGVVVTDEVLTMPSAMVPVAGSRFERLLSVDSSKVATNNAGTLGQVRDRVLHHIGREEDLYASVSRLGVGGDRLSLRF